MKNNIKYNTGNWNSGDCNSGDCNSGDCNSGNWNSGDCNSGDCNSGNWNSGDRNSGFFNTDTPKIRIFNKETDIENINFPPYFYLNLNELIPEEKMTEEEKKENLGYEIKGGFLKTYDYKEAWKKSFDENCDKEQAEQTINLPNFSYDIFEEITGITKEMLEKKLEKNIKKEIELEGREYIQITSKHSYPDRVINCIVGDSWVIYKEKLESMSFVNRIEQESKKSKERKLLQAPDIFCFGRTYQEMYDTDNLDSSNRVFFCDNKNRISLLTEGCENGRTPCGYKKITYGELNKGDFFCYTITDSMLFNYFLMKKDNYFAYSVDKNLCYDNKNIPPSDLLIYKVCSLSSRECDVYEQ